MHFRQLSKTTKAKSQKLEYVGIFLIDCLTAVLCLHKVMDVMQFIFIASLLGCWFLG
jgi:hypothetical protein